MTKSFSTKNLVVWSVVIWRFDKYTTHRTTDIRHLTSCPLPIFSHLQRPPLQWIILNSTTSGRLKLACKKLVKETSMRIDAGRENSERPTERQTDLRPPKWLTRIVEASTEARRVRV